MHTYTVQKGVISLLIMTVLCIYAYITYHQYNKYLIDVHTCILYSEKLGREKFEEFTLLCI